jgi:hypothetical protein
LGWLGRYGTQLDGNRPDFSKEKEISIKGVIRVNPNRLKKGLILIIASSIIKNYLATGKAL